MKLAVALIHGIGDQPDSRDEDGLHSYARELVAALRRRLGAEAGEVAFQSLYWASVLDARELAYLKRIEREPPTTPPTSRSTSTCAAGSWPCARRSGRRRRW